MILYIALRQEGLFAMQMHFTLVICWIRRLSLSFRYISSADDLWLWGSAVDKICRACNKKWFAWRTTSCARYWVAKTGTFVDSNYCDRLWGAFARIWACNLSDTLQIWNTLYTNVWSEISPDPSAQYKDIERLRKTITYLQEHYHEHVTLGAIAKMLISARVNAAVFQASYESDDIWIFVGIPHWEKSAPFD